MDYKDLVRRGYSWNGNHFRQEFNEPRSLVAEMCFAIENLLEERDAAVEKMIGDCDECIHADTPAQKRPCCLCRFSIYGKDADTVYWKWRGLKEGD